MTRLLILFSCIATVILGKATHKTTKLTTTTTESTTTVNSTTVKLECEGVYVHGKLHKRRIIMNGINRPYQLAVYDHEHQIFFSYNVGEDTKDTFGIAYVKEGDTMPTELHGVKNGFALAIDEHEGKIYFGGSEGVYSSDLKNSKGLNYILEDRDIWDIFYHKHHLYIIEFPSQRLHKYDIKAKKIHHLEHITHQVYQVAIDGDDDMFITTKKGLFEIKNGTDDMIHYSDAPKTFRAIEVNHKGVAYFCAKSSLYVADKESHSLKEIASIKNIFGVTFDSEDNIIYSNPHEIVKLLPHSCK